MSVTMEEIKDIHESNERAYKEHFRIDVMLLILIVVVAIPCNLFSGTVCFIEKNIVLAILNTLLFAVNAFNGVTTVKRIIRRHNQRKHENSAYNAIITLEKCCSEEESEL